MFKVGDYVIKVGDDQRIYEIVHINKVSGYIYIKVKGEEARALQAEHQSLLRKAYDIPYKTIAELSDGRMIKYLQKEKLKELDYLLDAETGEEREFLKKRASFYAAEFMVGEKK